MAPVRKPLASLAKITKAGNRIVMDSDDNEGSYIENKMTGERTYMREERNVFVFDIWLPPAQGFPGPGR